MRQHNSPNTSFSDNSLFLHFTPILVSAMRKYQTKRSNNDSRVLPFGEVPLKVELSKVKMVKQIATRHYLLCHFNIKRSVIRSDQTMHLERFPLVNCFSKRISKVKIVNRIATRHFLVCHFNIYDISLYISYKCHRSVSNINYYMNNSSGTSFFLHFTSMILHYSLSIIIKFLITLSTTIN